MNDIQHELGHLVDGLVNACPAVAVLIVFATCCLFLRTYHRGD